MGFLPPVVLELKAKADELYAELDKVKLATSKMADDTTTNTQKASAAFSQHSGAVALAGAALIGTVAGIAAEAAASAEVVDSQLRVSIENAGGSMEDMEPKIKTLDGSMRDLGFSNEDTNAALSTMTVALKDPEKAMGAMSVAADLARVKHMSLNDASLMVAKAMEGQTKPLKALGIDLPIHAANAAKVATENDKLTAAQNKVNDILAKFPDAADPASAAHSKYVKATADAQKAQENLTIAQNAGGEIMTDLKARIEGSASAYGDTLKGKMEETKAQFGDMAEKLGNALIPMLKGLADAGKVVTDWATANPVAFNVLIGVVGGLVVALTLWAAAQWAVNLAQLASPTTWIILAIVAAVAILIAIVVVIVANWDAMMSFLGDTWQHIADFFVTVGTGITKWWTDMWDGIGKFATAILKNFTDNVTHTFTELISFFVTVGTAIGDWWNGLWTGIFSFFATAWNDYVTRVATSFNDLVSFFATIGTAIGSWWTGLWTGIINVFQTIFGGIGSFVSGIFDGVRNTIVDALNFLNSPINAVIDGINTVLDGMKTVTGGAINLHIPSMGAIPHFDVGGTIPGAAGAPLLMVGHGGEEVLSREMLAGTQPISQRAMEAMNAHSTSGNGQIVNVYASTNASPAEIASTVGWQLRMMG